MTDKPKANQYVADPRQTEFISNYFDPKSKTYSNLMSSLVGAGYSEEYAKSFQRSNTVWLQESASQVTKDKLVIKAKRNLDKLLDSDDEKIQADITKFVAKTDMEFSEKQDITSKGEKIQTNSIVFTNFKNDSERK